MPEFKTVAVTTGRVTDGKYAGLSGPELEILIDKNIAKNQENQRVLIGAGTRAMYYAYATPVIIWIPIVNQAFAALVTIDGITAYGNATQRGPIIDEKRELFTAKMQITMFVEVPDMWNRDP